MKSTLSRKLMVGAWVVAGAAAAAPEALRFAGANPSPVVSVAWGLCVGSILAWFFSVRIRNQWVRLEAGIAEMTAGAWPESVRTGRDGPSRFFRDESDEWLVALDQATRRWVAQMREIESKARLIAVESVSVSQAVEPLQVDSLDISRTVSDLSVGLDQQQKIIEEVRLQIQEMSGRVKRNADHAREAFGFAAEANETAGAGVDIARLAVSKMRLGAEAVEQMEAKVFALEAKTRHVNQIAEIITDVAHRTNLLSLNASIEAARAGEAGRGFSVVADEIRKLSESAGHSAEQITTLMREIEVDTDAVSREMHQSCRVIGEGREDVDTLAAALDAIGRAVDEAATRVEDIFEGSDRRAADAELLIHSMGQMADRIARTGSEIEIVATAAEAQLESMNGVGQRLLTLDAAAAHLDQIATDFLRRCDPIEVVPEDSLEEHSG